MIVLLLAFLGLLGLFAATFFSIQNSVPVTVWFYNWKFEASLAIVVFLSILTGMGVTCLILVFLRAERSFRRRRGRRSQVSEAKPSAAVQSSRPGEPPISEP
jgi:uncharacterized integral membrane protein